MRQQLLDPAVELRGQSLQGVAQVSPGVVHVGLVPRGDFMFEPLDSNGPIELGESWRACFKAIRSILGQPPSGDSLADAVGESSAR